MESQEEYNYLILLEPTMEGYHDYNRLILLEPTMTNAYALSSNAIFINLENLITYELREGPHTTRTDILKKYLDVAGYYETSNEYNNLILANMSYASRINMSSIDLDGGKRKKNKRSLRKSIKRRIRRSIRRRSIRRRR